MINFNFNALPQNIVTENWLPILIEASNMIMDRFPFTMEEYRNTAVGSHHDEIVYNIMAELYFRVYENILTNELNLSTLPMGTVIVQIDDDFVEEVLRKM